MATARFTLAATFESGMTTPEALAETLDSLLQTALSTPGVLDEHGEVSVDAIIAEDCEGCDGSGIRAPAHPSCYVPLPHGFSVIERCDSCEVYPDDLAAARAIADDCRWLRCADGGSHAIGRLR